MGGQVRQLGLFEVLTRNRQSAVELFGRSRSAQQRTHRVFTIPPRQRLPSPRRLVLRRWRVTRARIRIIAHSLKACRALVIQFKERNIKKKFSSIFSRNFSQSDASIFSFQEKELYSLPEEVIDMASLKRVSGFQQPPLSPPSGGVAADSRGEEDEDTHGFK